MNLLAVNALSPSAQAIVYFIALVVFIVAAILLWTTRTIPMVLIAVGLALFAFVLFWNSLALS